MKMIHTLVTNQVTRCSQRLVANQLSQVVLQLMTPQGTTCSQVARCHGKWLDVTASD